MSKHTKQALLTQQPQLEELLATNKTLAGQKRQFHRQKLRAYSEKAVKLRSILRQTSDGEEKRCLQAKLKALQQKQDAQITKLAKIDQIQKQIDQFITQENEEGNQIKSTVQNKNSKNQLWFNQIENTPADRLRTKSSIPARNGNDSNSDKQFDFSRKRSNLSKKQENQQLLLKDSRQALEELANHANSFAKHREYSKNSVRSQEVCQPFSSYKKNDCHIFQASRNVKQTKPFWKQQECKGEQIVSYDSVPPIFLTFVDKVSKFWPKDLEQLIKYFKESEFNRKKLTQKQKQFDSLALREQKIKRDEERIRKEQQRFKKAEQKFKIQQQKSKYLISEQRRLMQNIDRLQKQQENLKKQIDCSFQAIAKSAQLISSSSFLLNQSKDPIQINCLHSDSVHKFSVDSFDSATQGSLYHQLCKFQKRIQKYLLSAERAVMMISGEMQQNSSKFAKAKQQNANLEARKKTLQSELTKLENSITGRKNLLKELENGLKTLQTLIKDNNDTLELKKAISQQLEQKCEKLKTKKKTLTEKVKKLEEQVQAMTFRKQQLFVMKYEAEQRLAGMKSIEKELETKLIFYERDKDNRLKDLEELQKKQEQLINHLQQTNKKYEDLCSKTNQTSKSLTEFQQKLKKYQQQQISYGEKAQKLQQQLAQATSFLEQQNATAQRQMQEISKRSQQHLQIQTKIAQTTVTLRQHQKNISQLQQQIQSQMQCLHKGKEQMTKIENAKQELEKILHEIMQKKQWLISEIQQRGKQLEILLTDMQNGKEDYRRMLQTTEQFELNLSQKQNQLKDIQSQIDELGQQLESELLQQSNILGRINRLKEFQKSMLLQIGVKGTSDLLQEQLKTRVDQAVAELSALSDLKSQLKQCKYQNRKLKVENQRMSKLLGQTSLTD